MNDDCLSIKYMKNQALLNLMWFLLPLPTIIFSEKGLLLWTLILFLSKRSKLKVSRWCVYTSSNSFSLRLDFYMSWLILLSVLELYNDILLQSNFQLDDPVDDTNRSIILHDGLDTHFLVRLQVIIQFLQDLLLNDLKLYGFDLLKIILTHEIIPINRE